jgi:hypothetical protein
MAFPDSIKTFVEAVDPSSAEDIQKIQQYQEMLSSGNFSAASNFLAAMENGMKMNISAGRFNDVLTEIVAIEKFYFGLNGVKELIQKNINAYSYVNEWNGQTTYHEGNLANRLGTWFLCIKENTNIEPYYNSSWKSYWKLFVQPQSAKSYPIQAEMPEDQDVGDLWFKQIKK